MTSRRQPAEQAATAAIEAGCRHPAAADDADRFAEIADAADREQLTYRGVPRRAACWPNATTATHRRAVRRRPRRRLPPRQTARRLRLHRQPRDQPGHHQHPRRLRLDPQRPTAVSDRRLRHRQDPPADRVWAPPPPNRATGSATPWPPSWSTSSSRPPTNANCPAPSPATAASICSCIDELGYLELDRRGAELLFQVLTEREEKNAVAIASNDSLQRLDQDLHRPPTLRRHRRPAHLRRPHHRDRHQLLPPRPRPSPTSRRWGQLRPSPWGQVRLTQPLGVAEVDLDSGGCGEPGVLGHLVTRIPGQRLGQWLCSRWIAAASASATTSALCLPEGGAPSITNRETGRERGGSRTSSPHALPTTSYCCTSPVTDQGPGLRSRLRDEQHQPATAQFDRSRRGLREPADEPKPVSAHRAVSRLLVRGRPRPRDSKAHAVKTMD